KLEGADGPKYLNPGGTPIYDKSKVLYGLSAAKADIVSVQEAIVCEGYTDVIGFFRAGMGRAVATCGTALTEDHVKLLTRFAKRLVLAFDADGAGQAAAERFHQWEQTYELDVAVAALPPGQDPGELAQHDPEALRRAVEQALPFLAFRLQRIYGAADLHTAEGRARAAGRALDVIAAHPDPLVRDQYLLDVSGRCRIDVDQLRSQLTARAGRPRAAAADRERRTGSGPNRTPPGAASPRADDRRGRQPVPGDGEDRAHPQPWDDDPWAGRSTVARPDGGGRGADRHAVIDLREPARRAAIGSAAERDALRVAVDNADEAAEWLDAVLFSEGAYRRAFTALCAYPSLPDCLEGIESDDPDAAELLRQAAAEQSDATIRDVFLRLSQQAAHRALAELRQAVFSTADPLALTAASTQVAGLQAVLLSDDADDETKLQAGTDLLAWLLDPGEGTR
ncbi:MAG: toprim domain-containing protein, partial [Acidimicrobiales bacterium]